MNTAQNYKDVITFGKNIVEQYTSKSADDVTYTAAIMTLEHLERVLDLGRVLMTDEAMGELEVIHKGLSSLRGNIRELVAKIDRNELKERLESEAKIFNLRILT